MNGLLLSSVCLLSAIGGFSVENLSRQGPELLSSYAPPEDCDDACGLGVVGTWVGQIRGTLRPKAGGTQSNGACYCAYNEETDEFDTCTVLSNWCDAVFTLELVAGNGGVSVKVGANCEGSPADIGDVNTTLGCGGQTQVELNGTVTVWDAANCGGAKVGTLAAATVVCTTCAGALCQ